MMYKRKVHGDGNIYIVYVKCDRIITMRTLKSGTFLLHGVFQVSIVESSLSWAMKGQA